MEQRLGRRIDRQRIERNEHGIAGRLHQFDVAQVQRQRERIDGNRADRDPAMQLFDNQFFGLRLDNDRQEGGAE